MYFSAYDSNAGLLVAISAGALTKSDHDRSMAALARLDREGASRKGPLVTIMVIDADASLPTPEMRRDYAESQAKLVAPRHIFLLITMSRVQRGVITAVNWLRAPNPKFHAEAFATFEEGARFAERERGEALPQLTSLLAEARRGKAAQARTA